jgi:diguanylate cyclase (GGDEF)-like protein
MSDPVTTPPARPAGRARRGRVLLVGDGPPAGLSFDQFTVAPALAGNLFEAIGELSAAETARPIVAALVPDSILGEDGEHVAEALKRVDPSVILIRVIDPGRPKPETLGGFDACLTTPVDLDALRGLVGRDMVLEPHATGEQRVEPAREVASAEVRDKRSRDEAAIREEPASVRREAASGDDRGEDLGDTDLIQAVMHDPNGVLEHALDLIRAHTGWNDLRFIGADDAAGEQADHDTIDGAEVAHDDDVHGRLICPAADADRLQRWANWLAHWLTLDASYREYRLLTYRDDLTGAWNRRYMNRFLRDVIAEARRRRRPVTLMVFDIDDFKHYNDTFGHEAGDEILRETVALLRSVIRSCDRVCRVGGDEFAVIFADLDAPRTAGSAHPESVEQIAHRFQTEICTMRYPKLGPQAEGSLTISAGLATYPWDAHAPDDLLRIADARALESKRRGKNHITFGSRAADCDDDPPDG